MSTELTDKEKEALEKAREYDALPVQEVRIVTTQEALLFYSELLERAIRTAEIQLEDWRKEYNFVLEELKKYAP